MQVIRFKNDDTECHRRALLVSKSEWKRLQKILTKKEDDRNAEKESKRLRAEQRAVSKAIAESFDNTTLKNRKKELEKRQKLLAEIKARQVEKDKRIKQEILERRNMIVEKAEENKWLAKDSTKTLTRVRQNMEVLRERALQIEFNKAEKARALEEECFLKVAQNSEAEQHQKDQWEQKLKEAEIKKANAVIYLKLLNERKEKRQDEYYKLKEEDEAKLRTITKEIDEENKRKIFKIQQTKKNMMKNLKENREFVAKNKELRQLEEQEENTIIAIMAESKKRIARAIKLKEIEILREKLELSEKITEKAKENLAKKEKESDLMFKNAVDEKERQYQKECIQREELAKKRKQDFENNIKLLNEEKQKESKQLALNRRWEHDRRLREFEVLNDYQQMRKHEIASENKRFREGLDAQCVSQSQKLSNNKAARAADKQEEIEQYHKLIKLWRQEDDKFLFYTKNLIDKYKKDGRSVVPLLKAVEYYTKKNKLLMDAAVDKKCEV